MKNIFAFLALGLLGIFLMGCSNADLAQTNVLAVERGLMDVTPQVGLDWVNSNKHNPDFVILDVRTPEEYLAGHLAGAVNLDFYAVNFGSKIDGLDREDIYLIYCRSGRRSGETLTMMKKLDFKEVYNIGGGFEAAQGVGFEIVLGE